MQAYEWFQDLILLERATPEMLAVMAWIYAHAGDGLEFFLDDNEPKNIAHDTGSTPAAVEAALAELTSLGLIEAGRDPLAFWMVRYNWQRMCRTAPVEATADGGRS
jgi:hypothetical protein